MHGWIHGQCYKHTHALATLSPHLRQYINTATLRMLSPMDCINVGFFYCVFFSMSLYDDQVRGGGG